MKRLTTWLIGILYILLSLSLLIQFIYFEVFNLWIKALVTILYLVISTFILRSYTKINFKRLNSKMEQTTKIKIVKKKVRSKFALGFIVVCLLLTNYVYLSLNNALSLITNNNTSYVTIKVYALKNSNINDLKDIKNKMLGYSDNDVSYGKQALMNYLTDEYGFENNKDYQLKAYVTSKETFEALLSKSVSVISLDETSENEIIEAFPNFLNQVKLIEKIKEKITVESKQVSISDTPFNILIAGVDNREEDGPITNNTRVDTIMVVTINPKKQEVLLTSIPRDTYMKVSCKNDQMDKATHIGRQGGIPCLIESIDHYLDIEINYYIKLNFAAMVDVVDAIGDIEVDVAYPFCEMDSNDVPDQICLKEGIQKLNGEEALAYSRHRKSVTDIKRNEAQQRIIQAIVKKMASPTIITKFDALLKVVSANMLTNFSRSELYDLVALVPNLGSISFDNTVLKGEDADVYLSQYKQTMYVMKIPQSMINEASAKIKNLMLNKNEIQ